MRQRPRADLTPSEVEQVVQSLRLTPEQRREFVRIVRDGSPEFVEHFVALLSGQIDLRELESKVLVSEEPDIEQFLFDPDFIGMSRREIFPRLLDVLHEADKPEVQEVHLCLAKGSGKSSLSSILIARAAHRLVNVYKNPAAYFGLIADDLIGIVNMSPTAQQANDVVFSKFWKLIERSRCFKDANGDAVYTDTKKRIEFPNSVHVLSGHSNFRAYFGYNVYLGVIDEWSWFDNTPANPVGEEIYQGLKASAQTRFPKTHKIVGISTPQAKDDPLYRRVDDVLRNGRSIVIDTDGTDAAIVG